MQQFTGGYYMLKQPIIKTGGTKHTVSMEDAISPVMIEALNLIQSTPYAIDTYIAYWQREAFDRNDALAGVPLAEDYPLPQRVPDDLWVGMTKEQRSAHKASAAAIHDSNAALVGARRAFKRKLKIAFEMAEEEAIYFPCNFDFRLRVYPLPQDLNPQGDDMAKSLLQFAEGKPLGKLGAYWLGVALANAFGQDKITMDQRVEWAVEHAELLEDSVDQPLDGKRFWTTADEPWCALALAREFVGWLREGDDFVSFRPVNVDATCSGMQHLSAMARDPIGALSTNLTACPERQDLYGEVAKVCLRQIEREAAAMEEARAWLGKVNRKTVKRAVMTTPYGVTDRGIRDQLITDGHCEDLDGNAAANAEYMKGCIKEAMNSTARAAKEVMAYIQGIAKALAGAGVPFDWTTPAGSRIRQAYYAKSERRVSTVFGSTSLMVDDEVQGLNVRKQVLAAAPNFVHAADASHLAKTVVKAHQEHGIRHFAMIHDSYGCHAADVQRLNDVLRETFVEIYSEDWLANLEQEVRAYAPHVELPPRPELGDFDVTEVLEAPFFFS